MIDLNDVKKWHYGTIIVDVVEAATMLQLPIMISLSGGDTSS
jgi:hypothetical protein